MVLAGNVSGTVADMANDSQMEYRRLGNTGVKVSVLSFGSWVTFDNQLDTDLVKKLIAKITPTVPAPTSRAPAPIVMSEMCRTISRQRRSEKGMSPSAFA